MVRVALSSVEIRPGTVVANAVLCREHYRLTLRFNEWPASVPGQFVHLRPPAETPRPYRMSESTALVDGVSWMQTRHIPMLRRAFSIAGLTRSNAGVEIDVIYRVVGKATRWMASLARDDSVSALGPLGNRFPIHDGKRMAWLVAGGVGLPPMLWLAEVLRESDKQTTALCGARTRDLLPLTFEAARPPAVDAGTETHGCREFGRFDAGVVIATDDGSLGFHGHVGEALVAFQTAVAPAAADLVVYTCGPERMMRYVAEFCAAREIECHVCMERAMACGTGLCQSCVVPINDAASAEGWVYRLCCRDGPVFDGRVIAWEPQQAPDTRH
ncbi:MAG: dihydroorotate dehydrogenase electron transfer subunit [Phycisphaerae bacterium]